VIMFNRRPAQTGFIKVEVTKKDRLNRMMVLNRHINKNNHATRVIDMFFVPRVAGQKGLR
jgi:hypothetical protein